MAERYRQVERVGFSSRMASSFVSVFVGLILFLGSFWLLFWNEGRVNLAQVAVGAIEINPLGSPSAPLGSLVSLTGQITSNELLGDNLFLRPGPYVAINRLAEMYAWEEEKETRTQEELGGSETRETIYTYTKVWTENPEDSSQFYRSSEHINPAMPFSSQLFRVNQAQIGNYIIGMQDLRIETPSTIPLHLETLIAGSQARVEGSYVFKGQGTLANPQIGDMRTSYTALHSGTLASVFGRLASPNSIESYLGPRNVRFYRLFAGDRFTAIERLTTEHNALTWILRFVGFLMMWIGSDSFFAPLHTMLSIFPFLSGLGRFMTRVVTFFIALVLTGTTILVSLMVHNPVVLLLCLGVAGAFILNVLGRRPRRQVADF